MTKIFYPGPDRRVGRVVARLGRQDLTMFIRAITGHNNLNYMNSIIIPGYTSLQVLLGGGQILSKPIQGMPGLLEGEDGNTGGQNRSKELDSWISPQDGKDRGHSRINANKHNGEMDEEDTNMKKYHMYICM